MKEDINALWKIGLMFISPVRNYRKMNKENDDENNGNKFLVPLIFVVSLAQTLKNLILLAILSPFKLIVWATETR